VSRLRHRGISPCVIVPALIALLIVGSAGSWAAQGSALQDLAGPLRALAVASARGEMLPLRLPLPGMGPGDSVLVVVEFRSDTAAAHTSLAAYGGEVQIRRDRRVQALLPVSSLLAVAGLPQVSLVRPPGYLSTAGQPEGTMYPMQGFGPNVTEGLQLVGALPFFAAGIEGQGVNVAVIASGFAGYAAAEIPNVVNTLSFPAALGVPGTDTGGTEVAEIIADFVPQANFTLIRADTALGLEQAAEYVGNQGFDVCCMAETTLGGPYDGTHPLSQEVNQARAAGVFMVNSAGMLAEHHYQGQFADADGDGLHEFGGGDETLDLTLGVATFMAWLSWYQTTPTGLTNHDFDLVLVDAFGAEITRSGYSQNGDDPPADVLTAPISTAGQYGLRIEYYAGPPNPGDYFQLFVRRFPGGNVMEAQHQVRESSIAIPAEASGAYAVGATRGTMDPASPWGALSVDQLEQFSPHGPVVDHPETIKPNIVGPDAVTTSLQTPPALAYGVPIAAAHVAGAAALLLCEDALRTADEVESMLSNLALDLGTPGPDNLYGAGRLRLRPGMDSRAPTITIAFPRNGETITTSVPTVTAFIQDDGSGVDPSTIIIELDGVEVFNGSTVADITAYYNAATGRLTWTVEYSLTRSNHTLLIDCEDNAGNAAASGVVNFRVAAPTIAAGVHIVSFPYRDLEQTDPGVILGMPLQGADALAMVRWCPLAPADHVGLRYYQYPEPEASLTPPDAMLADPDQRTVPYPPAGLGYFLSLPRTAVLEIRGSTLNDVPSTHIRLYHGDPPYAGWNLIGNPYEQPISWGTVQFVTAGARQDLREAIEAGVTEGVLFEYVGATGGRGAYYDFSPYPTAAMLEPMKGYWLHVNQETRVEIYGGGLGTAAEPAATAADGADGWLLRLSAVAGGYQDPSNYIGVSSAASAGYDPGHDVPEPPALVGTLQMYMPRPGWGNHAGRYAKDVRASTDGGVWDVDVLCKLPDSEVEITWPALNAAVPADVKLILEDLDGGRTVYMRTSTGYRFPTGPEGCVRHLRIRAETAAGQTLALNAVTVEGAPGAKTVITYALSKSAAVSIEVSNIAGRLVKRFASRQVEGSAQQSMVWNGVGQLGNPVPAGRYLLRLTARAHDGETVQAIRPFDVMR
jgi:hypothetical protein